MEFYRAAMHDFNSLSDDEKAIYIAEAKKRNTVKDRALGAKWVSKEETIIDKQENDKLVSKALHFYHLAARAEQLKNTGKPDGPLPRSYYRDLKTAEDRLPYLAEATLRQVEEHADVVENCPIEYRCDCEILSCRCYW